MRINEAGSIIYLDNDGKDLDLLKHIVGEYYDLIIESYEYKQHKNVDTVQEAVKVALIGHQLGVAKLKLHNKGE